MRKPVLIAALTASIALAAWSAGMAPAVAAPSVHSTGTSRSLDCSWLTNEGSVVFLGAQEFEGDTGAFLFVESADGPVLEGWGGSAVFDEGGVFASVDLTDLTTEPPTPAGIATVSVSRVQKGAPSVIVLNDRQGNEVTKGTETHQDYAVSVVEVSVPGHTIIPDPTACTSTDITFDVRSNAPAATIYASSDVQALPCRIGTDPLTEALLSGSLPQPTIQVVIHDDPVLKASGTVPLRAGAGSAILPLRDVMTGDPHGEVRVDLAMSKRAGLERASFTADGFTERTAVRLYDIRITLTSPTGTHTATCAAREVSSHTIIRPSARR